MATRYFNWKLAIVLFVAVVVFVIAVFGLHSWQKTTKAEQALPRGQKAFEAKQWDEAADQLGRYLAVNNQDASVLIQYAEAQLNRRPVTQGNVQMAIAAYRNALRFKPDDVETARRLAEVYLSMGAPAEAESTAERHLERRDDPGLRRLYAQALWQQRKFNQAIAEAKAILDKYPGEILAYEFMGFAADARPEAADRASDAWFDEAVTKNPDSALAYAVRASHHLRKGNKDQALADLTRAAACDLSDKMVRLRVIREFINAKAWEQARTQLQALREIDATEVRLWQTWAELAVESRSQDEMYMVAEEGMKSLGAQPWDFMSVAAHLLILSGHLEKVEGYLSQMKGQDIDPAGGAYLAGLLAERQGRIRDAIGHWQRAIALGTRIPEEVYRQMALGLARLGDVQSAINQLQILLSKRPASKNQAQVDSSPQPEYVRARLQLAQLFARVGKWSRVLEQTPQILEAGRSSPDILLEATLLELQARTYLLAVATGSPESKEQAWRSIETRLADLDKASDKASEEAMAVQLLRVQVAMMQEKFSEASTILSELEGKYPSDIRLMLRRAELCAAQGQDDQAKALFQKAIVAFPQAVEPVRGVALLLDAKNQRSECESTIKDALARMQEPGARRDLGLLLSEFYYRWQEKEKLCQWLTELTVQFPSDIQPKRLLLACESIAKDEPKSQKIIDEIKALEDEKGTQWRYEQARLWIRSAEFRKAIEHPDPNVPLRSTSIYAQVVKLLQENLLTNPEDQASRLLLAGAYEMAGEPQLALTTYREAFARTPNDTQVLVRLITALHKANEFDEAQGILDKVGQQDLIAPGLQRLQVDNDFRRGDLASASNTLQQLVEQDPNDATLQLSYARVLVLKKEFAKAQAILDDLKVKQPDSILVARAQIRLYVQQGNTDKALQICNEMVDKLHNAAAYLLRVEMYIDLRQADKALEDLGQAVALEPQNVGPWEARARIYTALGRTADAISDARQALALEPQETRIQKLAISLFMASGKQTLLREAEGMLDKMLAGQPNSSEKKDPEAVVLKSQILMMRATGPAIEEARRLLRQVTADYPKYARGWEVMVQLELQQDEPGRAMDYATRGLAHNEQNKQLLLLKAIAEKRLSPSVAALTTLPSLAAQYPDDVGILIEWADAYARADRSEKAVELLNGKLASFTGLARRRCEIALAAALYADQQRDKAKTLFETLITAESNDPTPVMTLGQLLRKERRWTEVNQLVNLWRTTNPKDAETATNMARILAGSGDREALQMAEDQLRMILEPNPDSVSTLLLLGMLMQDAGRDEEATRLNRRLLAVDPNNVIAINNLAWLLCESPTASPETMQESLQLANRGLTLVSDYMDLLDTRGVVHYRLGNHEKAEADLRKCLELFPAYSPQSAAPQFHLARVYAAMNRKTEALEHLKVALSLNGKNVQLAREHAEVGRRTHAIKVLRDALSLQEEMDRFKTGFDSQDLVGVGSSDWTEARLLLEQLQKGQK